MAAEDLVMLYRAPDAEEAALLASALDAEGVPARTVGGSARWGFGELGMDALRVEIWVHAASAEAGKHIVERFYARRESENPAPAWTCTKCGEANDGGFQVCWQCQEPQPAGSDGEKSDPPFDPSPGSA